VPAPPPDRLIDDIYCLTGVPRHRRMNIPPMPSAHLFINLGGPVRLWDSVPSVPPAVITDGWFMGVWTRRFLVASEQPDRWVPVDAVWQRSVDRIRNQVGDIASATETLRVVEEELRSRLAEASCAVSADVSACECERLRGLLWGPWRSALRAVMVPLSLQGLSPGGTVKPSCWARTS
jgi:hypothetical protein